MADILFDTGGLGEMDEWEIRRDVDVCIEQGRKICKHCRPETTRNGYIELVAPAVVYVQNEGGYNSTSVCLMCIIEAAEGLLVVKTVV